MRTVTVLGSTGSIGTQTLEVVAAHPDRFRVVGLGAGSNADLLASQADTHRVSRVALASGEAASSLRERCPHLEVGEGARGVAELAAVPADIVVNGMVGSRGLPVTLAALEAGNPVALANKESLIVGGQLVLDATRKPDQLIPVDSEHSALAQCLRAGRDREVARVVLTASGGPFRGRDRAALEHVRVEDALAHPTWDMGQVITVNSATLANKGLEVIEAHLLFGIGYDRIEIVVHPQSVVHGMVEFCDGSTVAQLSPPDMRLPIQLALAWPERLDDAPATVDWTRAQRLDFEPVDHETFPMIRLAVAAGRAGGTYPGVFNAANEEAVAAFLDARLAFLAIPEVVEQALEAHVAPDRPALAEVLAAEDWARERAHEIIRSR